MTRQGLAAANTFFEHGPTFVGNTSKSIIDHIALPLHMRPTLHSATTWTRAARRLQISRHFVDNIPLVVQLSLSVPWQNTTPLRQRWSPDLLSMARTNGYLRQEFLEEVEAELVDRKAELAELHEATDPSHYMSVFVEIGPSGRLEVL